MPQKLDWNERHLFVHESPHKEIGLEFFLKQIAMYQRAVQRCAGKGATAAVLGRRLTKTEIFERYQRYVRDSKFTYQKIAKKSSQFLCWSRYAKERIPLEEPVTIFFCSPDQALCVLCKIASKSGLKKLGQAISEGHPYLLQASWNNEMIALFGDSAWKLDSTETKLDLADLRLLILDRIDRDRRKLETLRDRYSGEAGRKLEPLRRPIPESVRMYVWRRDQGRCSNCGSQDRLEFDHIIPFSRGGSSTDRNIQLLCEKCNRSKKDRV